MLLPHISLPQNGNRVEQWTHTSDQLQTKILSTIKTQTHIRGKIPTKLTHNKIQLIILVTIPNNANISHLYLIKRQWTHTMINPQQKFSKPGTIKIQTHIEATTQQQPSQQIQLKNAPTSHVSLAQNGSEPMTPTKILKTQYH